MTPAQITNDQYAENLLAAREKLMLTITHDIKAPAGSIIGYIDLLLRLVHDQRQQFYLRNMQGSARHLLELVTSLLDYHRLEAGKMDLHPVAFNPYELFEHIYTSFLPIAGKKQLELIFHTDLPHDLNVEGDPFRIRQIAENLLSNALKFTEKGNITLYATYKESHFRFQVSDTGCGMNAQEQARVFQAFTRLRSAQGQEGFGLGLSITKKLVELLNGNIRIESTPGTGSTFYVSMPLPQAKTIAGPPEETTLMPDKQWHILLIDDDRIQLTLNETMLRAMFAHLQASHAPVVHCCTQPDELFKLLRSEPADLILTDIQMPAMNGFELLKAIRKLDTPQAQNVPVIAITARNDMNESRSTRPAGIKEVQLRSPDRLFRKRCGSGAPDYPHLHRRNPEKPVPDRKSGTGTIHARVGRNSTQDAPHLHPDRSPRSAPLPPMAGSTPDSYSMGRGSGTTCPKRTTLHGGNAERGGRNRKASINI